MDILNLLLDLYEQSPQHQLDEKNFQDEILLAEKFVTQEEVNEYIRKNPDDVIGKFGKLLLKYQQMRPLHEWDVQRMVELSSVTALFIEEIMEYDPDATASAELDELTGTTACVTITLSPHTPFDAWGNLFERFQMAVQSCGEISIHPLVDNRLRMILYFKNVKKPVT